MLIPRMNTMPGGVGRNSVSSMTLNHLNFGFQKKGKTVMINIPLPSESLNSQRKSLQAKTIRQRYTKGGFRDLPSTEPATPITKFTGR